MWKFIDAKYHSVPAVGSAFLSVSVVSLSFVFIHAYLQNPERLVTAYSLHLIFGLIILPEETAFAHPVELQASLQDVGEIFLCFGQYFVPDGCFFQSQM